MNLVKSGQYDLNIKKNCLVLHLIVKKIIFNRNKEVKKLTYLILTTSIQFYNIILA